MLMGYIGGPGEKTGAEDLFAGDLSESISEDFFTLPDTKNYISAFHFNEDYLPIGSAKPMCLHFEWIKKEQRLQLDNYIHI